MTVIFSRPKILLFLINAINDIQRTNEVDSIFYHKIIGRWRVIKASNGVVAVAVVAAVIVVVVAVFDIFVAAVVVVVVVVVVVAVFDIVVAVRFFCSRSGRSPAATNRGLTWSSPPPPTKNVEKCWMNE